MNPRSVRSPAWCIACAGLTAACGARSRLESADAGPIPVDASDGVDVGADAQPMRPTCRLDDMSTWRTERFRDEGDYERTAVAVGGLPWVALKVRNGNIVLANVAIDDARGIVFAGRVEVPDSPVYPVALDVDADRFVFLTTAGINWNGNVELWRVDRKSGAILRVPVGNPPADPAYTVESAIGLAGSDIVVAYGRGAENEGTVELRDDSLGVRQSITVGEVSFTAVRASNSAVDVYAGASTRIHAEGSVLTQQPSADPSWQVIGGIGSFLVQMGQDIRLTGSGGIWSAMWPDTQISPPAIVRTDGARAAFSLETELSAVVGYQKGTDLTWMSIEPATDAPGFGLGLLPFIGTGRLGVLYLGLEVPRPEQPLRYFGKVCN